MTYFWLCLVLYLLGSLFAGVALAALEEINREPYPGWLKYPSILFWPFSGVCILFVTIYYFAYRRDQ